MNPKDLSAPELERLTRAYVRELAAHIGPNLDIPAPDVNTSSREMGWFVDEYEKCVGHSAPGVVTGKPLALGGSAGRTSATGRGAYELLGGLAEKLGIGKGTIAVQGFGNAAYWLASLAQKDGWKVIALSDSKGGIHDGAGLDVEALQAARLEGKKLQESGIGKPVSQEELLKLPCDILAPSAIENQITKENAGALQCKAVLEVANGPVTAEADDILTQKNILVVPDVLANAGGVTVSYFEWAQNLQREAWTEERVHAKLRETMLRAWNDVVLLQEKHGGTMREAAFILAAARLSEAMHARGMM